MSEQGLVTIARFPSLSLAQVAQSLLDSHGIKSYITNELMNTISGNILGEVELKVHASLAEESRTLLNNKDPHLYIVDSSHKDESGSED